MEIGMNGTVAAKMEKSQAELWLDKIETWDGQIVEESRDIFHNVEDNDDVVALWVSGLDATVYVFPDGSVALVDAEENSYGDTKIRRSNFHPSLPALVDWLTRRHTILIEKIRSVGDS